MSASHTELHLPAIERLGRALGLPIDTATAERLATYLHQVATWNRKINLTAAREPDALAEVMLADAMMLANSSAIERAARLVDIGTGAGAPIVPLLVLRPDLSARCVEPLQKRATFLRMLSVRLDLLGRMRVHQGRIEPSAPALDEAFDYAVSRATFAPEIWLVTGVQIAGRVIVMTAGGEPMPAPADIILESSVAYALPFSQAPRRATVYRRG